MTRTQNSQSENHGRYMASAELADLRGVSAVPVSFRAAKLPSAGQRDFIWWLQGESLAEGGFRQLARDMVEMFPERLGTEAMHKAKVQPDKMYSGEIVSKVEYDLNQDAWVRDALRDGHEYKPAKGADLIKRCHDAAMGEGGRIESVEQFLVEFCINPKHRFTLPGESQSGGEIQDESSGKSFGSGLKAAKLPYFQDIIGALLEFRAHKGKVVKENFYVTSIGRQIWNSLDYALRTRSMVLVYGREGRGKTEAVKAWAQLHSGQARFVSLKGIATKTAAFREIALALGITASYNLTGANLQSKIEDVLKMSGLMLVIDEAHFLFNQSQSTKARPELIDWLDTALANRKLPVALCSTPQFMDCMARAAYQVQWNYNQFRRRVKRWIPLPDENTEADILGVASKVFAGASSPVIKKVASYVFASGRDLSALGDVATELRELLGTSDFSQATFKQVDQLIRENLYPSDNAFITEMEIACQKLPKGRKQPAPALPLEPDLDDAGEADPTPSGRQHETTPGTGHSRRSGSIQTVDSGQPCRMVRSRPEPALTAH